MKFEIVYDYGYEKDKKIRIDNCIGDLQAKMRLHEYLIRKHGKKNLVVKSCVEFNETFNRLFGDIWNTKM